MAAMRRDLLDEGEMDENLRIAELLIRAGAEIDAEDEKGRRPLHTAALSGDR